MENEKKGNSSTSLLISFFWIISLLLVGFIGFILGQSKQSYQNNNEKITSDQTTPQISAVTGISQPIVSPTTPTLLTPTQTTNTCKKEGFAQKWEYLTSYVIKANDTLQGIAQNQLNDSSRTNEILQINGVGPLVVGATLYLPPPSVTKSSGNLKEVYGKLTEKNAVSWRVDFSNDPNGQGILIPTFWFDNIANKDSYKTGDCVKIFFDDGNTVYSVAFQ